jgi:two-component system NtrC family response regulator
MLEMEGMTRRILIVDDDSAMRQMLQALFQDEGWDAATAESVDSAVALLCEAEYGAVLSDIRMGGRSGLELVAELHRLWPDTPIVLMTAFGSADTESEARRAGASGYLSKPFDPETVLSALETAFERRPSAA